MAVAADSESAVSVSISDESSSSMTRPTLQTRKSLSSRLLTNDEPIKVLRNSNSAQRLSMFKKRLSSIGYKRSDSYQKIDANIESFNRSWNEDGSAPKHFDSPTKSNLPSRRGVRRRRSCDDDFHSLYKAAAMAITESKVVGNPQSADELPLHERDDSNFEGHSFVPNALSSPTFAHKSPGTSVSSGSKSSEKSSNSNDLLTRAAAVAGRKQRKQLTSGTSRKSAASSSDLATPITAPLQKLSAPQPGYSSSPHLPARIDHSKQETNRRQSDPAVELTAFSRKLLNNTVTSTPRTAGMNRRRSRRLILNETVMQDSNEEQNDEERRKQLFRSDFPGEPVPSDAILVRLYGSNSIPPPPQNRTKLPILSPEDLPKNSDHSNAMSFTTEPEWKAWNDSVNKSRRKRNVNDESRRSESSKSKSSVSSYRRSSSTSKLADAGDRSYSHSHSHSGSRVRGHKTRHNETSGSKHKSNRRREGSSHGNDYSSPKSRSRKKVETMKIRSKNVSKKLHSDDVSYPSNNSDYEAFQALLDLSNGSFFEYDDESSDYKTSESLAVIRASLPRTNSAPKMNTSFNDSVNSFGSFFEGEEKTDKERKKKRRGKRGDQEGKIRSRSADENRSTSTKSRRGKRGSKTKISKADSKFNDSKNSITASWFEESDSLLFDSSLRGPQWASNSERGIERCGKQHKSPKVVTRKNSAPENTLKQRKSPKFVNKKELSSESPGSLSTRKSSKKPSSSKTMTLTSQSSGELDPSLELGSANSRSMKHSVSKSANKANIVEDDECHDFPLSSWGDEPSESKCITTTDIVAAAATEILASPRIEMKSVGKSRWDAEPSPTPVVDDPAPMRPPPPPTTPPKANKKLDFPLNFVEYEDVSPLTVGSKKVELNVQLMTALNYLES